MLTLHYFPFNIVVYCCIILVFLNKLLNLPFFLFDLIFFEICSVFRKFYFKESSQLFAVEIQYISVRSLFILFEDSKIED